MFVVIRNQMMADEIYPHDTFSTTCIMELMNISRNIVLILKILSFIKPHCFEFIMRWGARNAASVFEIGYEKRLVFLRDLQYIYYEFTWGDILTLHLLPCTRSLSYSFAHLATSGFVLYY